MRLFWRPRTTSARCCGRSKPGRVRYVQYVLSRRWRGLGGDASGRHIVVLVQLQAQSGGVLGADRSAVLVPVVYRVQVGRDRTGRFRWRSRSAAAAVASGFARVNCSQENQDQQRGQARLVVRGWPAGAPASGRSGKIAALRKRARHLTACAGTTTTRGSGRLRRKLAGRDYGSAAQETRQEDRLGRVDPGLRRELRVLKLPHTCGKHVGVR